MSEQFEARLLECLDAIESSPGDGIEALLARYPEDAAALRHALSVAGALAALDMQPTADAQDELRRRFLAAGGALALAKSPRAARVNGFGSFTLRAGALVLAIAAAGAIPVAASGDALPGDPLYGVKRSVEDIQLGFASNEASRESMAAQNNARRIQEVDGLLRIHRDVQTEFEGLVGTVSTDALTVSGLSIAVPAGFLLPEITVGALVDVTVQVQSGQLTLVAIRLAEPVQPPAPTATSAPTLAPTRTPEPEPTRKDNSGPGTIDSTEDDENSGGEGGQGGDEIEPTEGEDDGGHSGGDDPTEDPTEDGSGGSGSNSGSGGGGDDGGSHGGGED